MKMLDPFLPQKREYKKPVIGKSDIITIEFQDKIKKIGVDKDNNDDFVIEKVVVETERIDAKEYVQSFADEVGIENILKKVALTGDPTLLNQRNRPTAPIGEDGREVLQDYANIPDNVDDASQIVKDAKKIYGELPKELVGDKSFAEFVETATPEELQAYVIKKMEAVNKKDVDTSIKKDVDTSIKKEGEN